MGGGPLVHNAKTDDAATCPQIARVGHGAKRGCKLDQMNGVYIEAIAAFGLSQHQFATKRCVKRVPAVRGRPSERDVCGLLGCWLGHKFRKGHAFGNGACDAHVEYDTDTAVNEQREYSDVIRQKALALGFDAVGFARADEPLTDDFVRYEEFLDAGYHGSMAYLADNREVRRTLDTDAILLGAKSIICVAMKYRRKDEEQDSELAQSIARYARGGDYHNFMVRKLRKLAAFIRKLDATSGKAEARPVCDTAPLLERAWAARAGLGFVGKNGLLIVPKQGSFVMLGEVLTTLELLPGTKMEHRCGSCTLCLDACPTKAFPKPFVLDARKCISYLTIESRAEEPSPLDDQIAPHLFGCDDCQTVCPFNRGEQTRRALPLGFEPLPRWSEVTLEAFLDRSRWHELSSGTPLKRAHPEGMERNARRLLAAAKK
jgi:epoxyqueuosine reductase